MQTQYSSNTLYGLWASYRFASCTCFFNLANALPLLLFEFLPKESSILVTFPATLLILRLPRYLLLPN